MVPKKIWLFLLVQAVLAVWAQSAPKTLLLVTKADSVWDEKAEVYESALREVLLEQGYRVLDPNQVRAVAERQLLTRLIQGDALAAVTLATNFKADALVVSKLSFSFVLQNNAGFTTFYTYKGLADIQVISASTAQVLISKSVSQTGTGTSQKEGILSAARKLGSAAGKEVIQKIANVRDAVVLRLTVTGVKSFSDAAALMRELSVQKGVVMAERKSFANGVLEAEVKYRGLVDDFAMLLESLKLVPLEVTEVSGYAIEAVAR